MSIGLLVLLLVVSAVALYYTGNVPKIVLLANAHGVNASTIAKRVFARK